MAAPMRQMSDARLLSPDRRGTHFWPHRAQPLSKVDATVPPPTPAPKVSVSAAPLTTEAGKRRYLTVMFGDLVDSMGIVARLDAADTHLLLVEGRSASDQVDRPAVHAIVASVA
jgi:hypothetical protein